MIYGSVCSGIEAASVAWMPLGWKCAFLSEIEAFPRAVLQHHYPDVPLHGDFTTIKAGEYEPIDILVGGTPCQSFSVAGLRGGMADKRGNLALEYLRLADRLRPRWIVWENVPGVRSSGGGRDFGSFLGGLGELGYGWAYRSLDAQYFGLAQRRERVFVVGCLGDWRRAASVLSLTEGMRWHNPPRRQAGQRIADSLTVGANQCSGFPGDFCEGIAPTISARTRSGGGLGTDFDCDGGLIPQQLFSIMPQNSGKDYKARAVDVAQTLMAAGPVGGNQGGDVVLAYGGNNQSGPIDIATACTAHGGPHGRLDFESETFVVGTLESGQVAVAFDLNQVTNPLHRPRISEHQPCGSLSTVNRHAVAFTQNQREEVRLMDVAGAISAEPGSHQQTYVIQERAVSENPAAGPDGIGVRGDGLAYTLEARAVPQAVAFQSSQSGVREAETHATLDANNGSRRHNGVVAGGVRRLTPTECERLMGVPDGYTLVPYRGKPAADGNRYKALGNSFAVPVVRWIGARIAAAASRDAA